MENRSVHSHTASRHDQKKKGGMDRSETFIFGFVFGLGVDAILNLFL